jgi:hypothetical protein
VGRKSSGVGDRGAPGYRREWPGGHQIEKGRYGLAMLNFRRFDKSQLIAVINVSIERSAFFIILLYRIIIY